MASGFDDDTPLSKHWHETFDEIFQAFSPDEWKLEPTDRNMPTEWRRFKDGAKVMFICDCGNSWTSMRGIVIFWFNKIGESERKEEVKTNAETEKNNEGKDGEHCEDEASSKNTIHQCTYDELFIQHLIFNSSVSSSSTHWSSLPCMPI